VPFGAIEWSEGQGGRTWWFDLENRPAVELRQKGRDQFVLLRSFCYLVAEPDPMAGWVIVIPGEDWPASTEPKRIKKNDRCVLIPPNPKGGETDLASVPWFMWWLIATYGNHTRACLLHDALYIEEDVDKSKMPVPRAVADRLLLTALREPEPNESEPESERKPGVFRHWLMWAAVSAFGTMGKVRGVVFSFTAFAFWGLLLGGVGWAWGRTIWSAASAVSAEQIDPIPYLRDEAVTAAVLVLAVLLAVRMLLTLLGGAWRVGVDNTGGWTIVVVILGLSIGLLLWFVPPPSFELASPFSLLLAALLLLFLGLLWGLKVDRSLWGWLWPTALIGLPIAMIPVLLIFLSVRLVRFIDIGAARVRALQRDADGNLIGYHEPDVKPTRFPF
jgi:Protein of unknown function (DUF1353)